jgi:hypothetical protein
MPEQKTRPHSGDVNAFIAQIPDAAKRADSDTLIALMSELTGEPPVLWGTMVGFGQYHYRYASGHEGDTFVIGFAPRKAAFSLYLTGCSADADDPEVTALLARLGKHRMAKACLYVKRLADFDMAVLHELARRSVAATRTRFPN